MVASSSSDNRTRIWNCLLYPESAPPDWETLISTTYVPTYVSPLHDKDINPDGTPKKPHYHVTLEFSGKKSFNQVLELISKFGGVLPQKCDNLPGYLRYFTHKDNPEKAQYSSEDIKCFNGADYSSKVRTSSDRYRTLREIFEYIETHHISYYSDILDYSRKNNSEWFEVCCDNTIVIKSYCVSVGSKMKDFYDSRHSSLGLSSQSPETD